MIGYVNFAGLAGALSSLTALDKNLFCPFVKPSSVMSLGDNNFIASTHGGPGPPKWWLFLL